MAMSKICCVVPTIRPESIPAFLEAWQLLFDKHNVVFVLVLDGENPSVKCDGFNEWFLDSDLVSNFCAGVRQAGFLFIHKYLPDVEYIFTTDDDCFPIGDPIEAHLAALRYKLPISWLSTSTNQFMRGFPYGVREEAPILLSHGVWENTPDYDAPTQLLTPKWDVPVYYKGVIPKGIFFPFCGMNYMFRREALPYIYHAPVGQYKGAERFDDIWAGLEIVRDFAKLNWGIVSGYAKVNHLRASNVFTSLEKEAVGIKMNEVYWKGEYDEWYKDFIIKRKAWFELTK